MCEIAPSALFSLSDLPSLPHYPHFANIHFQWVRSSIPIPSSSIWFIHSTLYMLICWFLSVFPNFCFLILTPNYKVWIFYMRCLLGINGNWQLHFACVLFHATVIIIIIIYYYYYLLLFSVLSENLFGVYGNWCDVINFGSLIHNWGFSGCIVGSRTSLL